MPRGPNSPKKAKDEVDKKEPRPVDEFCEGRPFQGPIRCLGAKGSRGAVALAQHISPGGDKERPGEKGADHHNTRGGRRHRRHKYREKDATDDGHKGDGLNIRRVMHRKGIGPREGYGAGSGRHGDSRCQSDEVEHGPGDHVRNE